MHGYEPNNYFFGVNGLTPLWRYITMTKAKSSSNVVTEYAYGTIFNQDYILTTLRGAVTPNQNIGDPTTNQPGQYRPNIQSVLEQLIYAMVPVNGVIVTISDESPGGVAFIEDLTVTGTSTGTVINVYGIPVEIAIGDTNLQVVDKIINTLNGNNMFVSVVNQGSGVIRFTHADQMPHANVNILENGISILGTTVQSSGDSKYCYGVWEQFHSEVKGTETLYYWKRTA